MPTVNRETQRYRQNRVAELTLQGRSASQISRILGISTKTVTNYRRKAGILRHWKGQISPEEQCQRGEDVRRLTEIGMTARQIGVRIGLDAGTVQRYRHKLGLTKQPPAAFTAEELATAERLLADGASVAEVARTLGRSETGNLYRRFRGRGWSTTEAGSFAATMRWAHRRELL